MVPGPNGDVYVRIYGALTAKLPVIVLHRGPAAAQVKIFQRRYADRPGAPGRSAPAVQICVRPPSTNSSAPLMKLASSDARNNAALAISSGRPTRPTGIWVAR